MNHSSTRIFINLCFCVYNLSSELISYDSAIVKEVCLGVDTRASVGRASSRGAFLEGKTADCGHPLQQTSYSRFHELDGNAFLYGLNLCPPILILLRDEVSTAHPQLSVTFIKACMLSGNTIGRWINSV